MALGDSPFLKSKVTPFDDDAGSGGTGPAAPAAIGTDPASREAAALRSATPNLPMLSRQAPAAGTGLAGGVGGDGFSSLDFGNDPAPTPAVAAQQSAGSASDRAAFNAAASGTAAPAATKPALTTTAMPQLFDAAAVTKRIQPSLTSGGGGGGPENPSSSGVIVGGRSLPYGGLVNGVPTFSDGSGTGAIPRTMSNDTILHLGDRLPTAPAPVTPLASDALGYTPTSDQMVAALQRNAQANAPITGSRPSAADFAASDANSIASRDWRSAAGTAAHNLAIDAQYAGTPRLRRAAADTLGSLQQGANQAVVQAQQGDQALAQENMRGQYGLAQGRQAAQLAALTRTGHPVTLEDGTLGVMDPLSGRVTASTQANGQPAKALVSKMDAGEKRSDAVMDQIGRATQEMMKNYMPTKDQPAPTPEMIAAWREQAARSFGLRLGTDPATGGRVVQINGQAIPL